MTDEQNERAAKVWRAALEAGQQDWPKPIDDRAATAVIAREFEALEAENARLREALIWCSGSNDFNEGGVARVGWLKLCAPLLARAALGASHDADA